MLIRKVKVLKKPKFDLTKLMELYSTKEQVNVTPADVAPEAQNLLSKQ